MTCIPIQGGFVCTVSVHGTRFRVIECPWELERRRFFIQDLGYYGSRLTCTRCGFQTESDGSERMDRSMGIEEAEKRARWARSQKADNKKFEP